MESSTFPMAIFFGDTMRTASLMEKVNIFGKMEPIIKAILSKAFVKAKDSGRVRLEIYTTGISVETEKMGLECITGQMGTTIRGNSVKI